MPRSTAFIPENRARKAKGSFRPPSSSAGPQRLVARRAGSLVFLDLKEVWAIEVAAGQTLAHSEWGKFDMEVTLETLQTAFPRDLVRVHGGWAVNLAWVRELHNEAGAMKLFVGPGLSGTGEGLQVPVSQDRSADVRARLLANAAGLRRKSGGETPGNDGEVT